MKRSPNLPTLRLSENANLLVASFAIAFVMWVFAKTAATEDAHIDVPVVLAEPKDSSIDVRITPSVVPVRLRYPKNLESDISSSNFRFVVDISDMRSNLGLEWKAKTLPLSERQWMANVPRANRIELVKIGQDSNTVRVEARWNALPAAVEPQIVGVEKMKPGIQLVSPVRAVPREVWVVGSPDALASMPRDEVTSRLKVLTEPINVADKTQTSLESVLVQLPPGVDLVQRPSKRVEVNLEIQEVHTIREIKGVRVEFAALSPESVRLEYPPTSATVTVYGPTSLLQQLGSESFEIIPVRPAEEVPGTVKDVPLEVRWAPGVSEDLRSKLQIRSVDPKTLPVKYVATETPFPPR